MLSFKYMTGEEVRKGDQVLFHRTPRRIEFIALAGGDPELDWYVQEYGGGVMLWDSEGGSTFIPADQIGQTDDLEFVSRS
jgi:hypothetical protein